MNYRDYSIATVTLTFITATHLNQPTLQISYARQTKTRVEAFQQAVDLWLDPAKLTP